MYSCAFATPRIRAFPSIPTARPARPTSYIPVQFSCWPARRGSLGRSCSSISCRPHMRLRLAQGIRQISPTRLARGRLAKRLASSSCGCVMYKVAFTTLRNRAYAMPAQRLTIRSSRSRFAARLNSGVRRRGKLMDAHSKTAENSQRRRPFVVVLVLGFVTTAITYGAALACAAAQLHSAVVILAWPTFALTRLLPPSAPVTSGSPENPWPLLASVALAWLIYSSLWYLWLGRRRSMAVA